MRHPALLSGLLLCLAPRLAFAQPTVLLEDYGVICDVRPEATQEAPGTVSGILNIIDQDREIDVTTDMVPAEIGLSFGIRARLSPDAPPIAVEVIVTHPPMGAAGQEVERWTASLTPGGTALNLFSFEEPYELVEGPWRFQLAEGNRVLVDQSFMVTPRGTVPAVQATCFGSMVLS